MGKRLMANTSLVSRISTVCLVAVLTCISLLALAAEQPAEPKWTETVAGKKTDTTSENDSAATQDASIEVNRVSKNIQQLKQQVIDLNKERYFLPV